MGTHEQQEKATGCQKSGTKTKVAMTNSTWGDYSRNGHRLLCADGIIRAAELASCPDTYFSVPATVRVNGKRITGYATTEESQDGTHHWCFRPHNGQGATAWPERNAPEFARILAFASL